MKTVCADPVLIGNQQAAVARTLAPLLQMNEADLYQRLLPRLRQNEKGETVTNRYVVLQHKVRDETWQKFQQAMSRLSFGVNENKLSGDQRAFFRNLRTHAIFTSPVDDQLRVYPNGSLAAHVLGFVGTDELSVDGQAVSETSGQDGVELSLNSALSGVPGWRVTEMDRRRQELVSLRDQDVPPRDGYNVVLTIDARHPAHRRNRADQCDGQTHARSASPASSSVRRRAKFWPWRRCPISIRTIPARHPPTPSATGPSPT